MKHEEIRQRNKQIIDELQEERLFTCGHHIKIDFGRHGFYHEDLPNITHGSDESIRRYLPEYREVYEKPFCPSGIKFVDTRPAIGEVASLVRKVENKFFAIENPDCEYLEYVRSGHWDEGIGVSPGLDGKKKWELSQEWLAVFVVEGGSEGYWLHVEAIGRNKPPRPLLLGKTLVSDWDDCYRSAGRIAWMLEA